MNEPHTRETPLDLKGKTWQICANAAKKTPVEIGNILFDIFQTVWG